MPCRACAAGTFLASSTVEFSSHGPLRPWAGVTAHGWKESNLLAPVLEAGLLPLVHPRGPAPRVGQVFASADSSRSLWTSARQIRFKNRFVRRESRGPCARPRVRLPGILVVVDTDGLLSP